VTGLLRINAPRGVLRFVIEPMLAEFCAAHPHLQVEIFAEDALIDIVDEGFDAGIRIGETLNADMVAVRLTQPFDWVVVGSPDYIERFGRPKRPEDLKQHRCIRYRLASRGGIYRWEFEDGNRALEVSVDGPVIVNDTALNILAAVKGMGLAYTAAPLVQEHLASGELVRVLDKFVPRSPGLFLYYPSRAQTLPKLRAFAEFAKRRLKSLRSGVRA
jgi:DNA-binding transcriptional LysR family regulator